VLAIRPLALAVPRRGDDLLVFRGYDPTRDQTFYRPLGGGIEFGETAEQALHRELREELDTGLTGVRLLGVLENIFHGFGRDGHEITFIFACDLDDPALYEQDEVGPILDDSTTSVVWHPLSGFTPATPLYPAGLAGLLAADATIG
jgi:ADP-ribose pyrophosphatase YjhB (NUDIX family)